MKCCTSASFPQLPSLHQDVCELLESKEDRQVPPPCAGTLMANLSDLSVIETACCGTRAVGLHHAPGAHRPLEAAQTEISEGLPETGIRVEKPGKSKGWLCSW